jgi:hypothetical protein
MPPLDKMYAIAVRDGGSLFLFLRVKRNAKNEVFVLSPRDEEDWDPHASFHSDGTLHQKSYDHKSLVRSVGCSPAAISETLNLQTLGIAADEVLAINCSCDPIKFSQVFEIPITELSSDKYRTIISVDATPPGGQPTITKGARVLMQWTKKDSVPWIVVSLFETP